MLIRPRGDDDLDGLLEVVARVHATDRYPPHVGDGGLREFVFGYPPLAAWVAEEDGRLVGHVALHTRSLDGTMDAATTALGVTVEQLGVVARLFVDLDSRGLGLGEALVDVAANEARLRGLIPILDTAEHLAPAIALYERLGWRHLSFYDATIGAETRIGVHVYAAPDQ